MIVLDPALSYCSLKVYSTFARTRHRVNVPALVAWVSLNLGVLSVWVSEFRGALSASTRGGLPYPRHELLAAVGFLLQSVGTMRAGFKACMTSNAEMRALQGALTLAASTVLASVSLVPLAAASPIARIYLAGNVSVLYNTLINAAYAYKLDRERARQRVSIPRTSRHKL